MSHFRSKDGTYKLPKNLLDMKFMKKTKDKEEKRREDEDRKTMFKKEITHGMINHGLRFIEEPSLVPLQNLREGRFSYQGMNPEIEKIMENEEILRLEEEERLMQESREKTVTDADMVEYYSNLTDTVAQKYKSKKDRNKEDSSTTEPPPKKKSKFLKPKDDDF